MDFLDKIKKSVEENDLVNSSQEEESSKLASEFISTAVEVDEDPAEKVSAKGGSASGGKKKKQKNQPKVAKEDLFDDGPIGELTVDVYTVGNELVIRSAIAGVESEDLDIIIEDDLVVIKGNRESKVTEEASDYFFSECHWGSFKREIVLPLEVDSSRAKAKLEKGILIIRMPIIKKEIKTKVSIE